MHGKGSLLSKMPGDHWQQLANVRAYLSFMWAHPGKQLLFMGQEFGQPSEWSEERGLDWWILDQPTHRGLFDLVGQLNRVYRDNAGAVGARQRPGGLRMDRRRRRGRERRLVPALGRRRQPDRRADELLREPAQRLPRRACRSPGGGKSCSTPTPSVFGGSGVGNLGAVEAVDEPWGGRPASALVTLPPLGGLWLRPSS